MKFLFKQTITLILAVLMTLSSISVFNAEAYKKLYAEDGRSKYFPESQVEAQLTVGWYKYPVQRLYQPGKSEVFKQTEVNKKLKAGWSEEPYVEMFALDGRSKYVLLSAVEANKKVGWYVGKPIKAYAEDGRTKYIGSGEIAANEKVGWYTEPVQRLYAEGKSKVFKKSQVAAQLKVGWYTEPVQRLYAIGKSKLFKQSQVAAQLKVGWYPSPVITMYAVDGRTKVVQEKEKYDYMSVGWYLEPVTKIYSPQGQSEIIPKTRVEEYKNRGWSIYPFFVIKCSNDDWKAGKKIIHWNKLPGITKYNVTITEQRNSRNGDTPANTPIVLNNYTTNCIYLDTYPNCTYTIKVQSGNSVGEYDIYTGIGYDNDLYNKVYSNLPSSKAEADKLVVSVTVPVWRLSNGKKVSSTATFKIHKDIAHLIKLVFQEIYNGKEKFPFKDIGAYNWRGGRTEHNYGTAIDLNSNENYCIYSDGSIVGSYWKPGVDPYSIKPYGDVVRAFEKYGFTWGGDAWSSTRDYMHFSYLGT